MQVGSAAPQTVVAPISIRLDNQLYKELYTNVHHNQQINYQDKSRYGDMSSVLNSENADKSTSQMVPVNQTLTYPWLYVGQLRIRFGATQYNGCTGTMIAAKVLVTAAHCFYDRNQGNYQDAKFFPARNGDDMLYQPVTVTGVEYMNSHGVDLDNNEDIAIVTLETAPYPDDFWQKWGSVPMGLVTDEHFKNANNQVALSLVVAGYPVKPPLNQDGKLYMNITSNYRNSAVENKGNQFEHGALSLEGTSGGPIFAYDPLYDTFAMVGVISSQREWNSGDTWAVGIKLNQTAINRINEVIIKNNPNPKLTPPIIVQLR